MQSAKDDSGPIDKPNALALSLPGSNPRLVEIFRMLWLISFIKLWILAV